MLKRGSSVFLAAALMVLCFFSVPVFAAEPEFDISDYTIEDLQTMTTAEKKKLMEDFIETYNPYGIKDLMEQESSVSGRFGVQPLWSSDSSILGDGKQMATHQLITLEALSVFIGDYGFYNIDATSALAVALHLAVASGLPDIDETDSRSFKGHFYNPDTGFNLSLQTAPTAKTRVGEHYARATERLRTNVNMDVTSADFLYVLEYLGRALHYMQDACEPHHVSSQPAVLTSHLEFEAYVNEHIDTLLPNVTAISKGFYSQANNQTTQNLTHTAAVIAKLYANDVGRLNIMQWDGIGAACLENAVWHSARLIYKIFYDNGATFI